MIPPPPPPYTLHCLGRPALIGPDGRAVRFRTRKHLALLIYLAVEPRIPHRRERLAELLWPGAAPAEGRHSLSTALSVLRARLGRAAIKSSRDHVQLVLPELGLDLRRLADQELLETDLLPALEVGGFLEDFDIPGAPEFSIWRDQQRARWQPQIRDALLFLIDRCRRTGDFARIERYADRMLALDDLSEDGMRAKLEARAFAGDRLTALRLFEEWKQKLEAELGAVPSPLMEGMAIRLRRRGWERSNTKEIAPVPTDQWKGRRFVGRAAEYAALYEAWQATVGGSPRHMLVVGDSGVGKSTLAERLATAAGLSGGVSSRVQCYDLEHEIPYSALSNLVHGLVSLPGAAATNPEALAELSRTAPRVREHFQSIPAPLESQGENSRIRLTDAVQQLVCSVAVEQPVMLVVDDFHLADDASISVIHLLMRRIEADRVMVLLTARTGELGRSPNANRLREAQSRLRLTTLELPPLSAGESAALIENLMEPNEPPPKGAVLRALIRAGAGFPMALELLVEDWRLNGPRSLALSLDAMTEEPVNTTAPADAYRRLLDRLSLGVDATTRNVLNLAAVLGPRLNDLDMYALMDLSLGQTMSAMSELTALRLLRDGRDGLEFVNELIRAQAYLAVPSPLRRTLHGRIADRLLELGSGAAEAAGLEIAWHCVRAGRVTEATPYLLRGAKAAMQRGAPYEAERALATALDRLEDPERSEAVILLARALTEQGRPKEAVSILDGIQPLPTHELGDEAVVVGLQARLRSLAEPDERTVYDLERLLQLAQTTATDAIRAQATTAACLASPIADSPELDTRLLVALSSIPTEQLDPENVAALAYAKAKIRYRLRDLEAAQNAVDDAISRVASKQLGSSVVSRLFKGKANISAARGDYSGALQSYERAWSVANSLGDDFLCRSVAGNIAVVHGRLGNFEEQVQWSTRALQISIETRSPHLIARHSGALALGYALLSMDGKALDTIRSTDDSLSSCTDESTLRIWTLLSADVLRITGDDPGAKRRARSAGAASTTRFPITDIVGVYARWTAIIGICGNVLQAQRSLHGLMRRRHVFDRLDQVETLNAKLWLDYESGRIQGKEIELFRQELASLPEGVRMLLSRLRMLTFLQD